MSDSYSERLELIQTPRAHARARDVLEHYTYRKIAGGWEAIKHENGKSKVAFRVKGSLAKAKADGRNREKFEHMK